MPFRRELVLAALLLVALLLWVGINQPSNPASAERLLTSPTALPAFVNESMQKCGDSPVIYPSWPAGFEPNVSVVFVIGSQKSGTTWMWHMLNAHPCLLSPLRPAHATQALTTKESYYFTSLNISSDGRQFLAPWLADSADAAAERIWNGWFEAALQEAQRASDAAVAQAQRSHGSRAAHIVFSTPAGKVSGFRACSKYYLLEATPHNLHSPIAAARIKGLFPDARMVATLKNPVHRFASAYNQFGSAFRAACEGPEPAPWCPVYRYYRLKIPTFSEAVSHDLAYMEHRGCTFQSSEQALSWMQCFGCEALDPWRQPALYGHPYVTSVALGMYAPMLAAWLDFFPADRFNVINYEEMSREPMRVVNRVLSSLGLEEFSAAQWDQVQAEKAGFKGHYGSDFKPDDPANDAAKALLRNFYRSLNQQLDDLCKQNNITWTPFSQNMTLI